MSLQKRFQNYFAEKVEVITQELRSSVTHNVLVEDQTGFSFERFNPVSINEVFNVIKESSSTTCDLDPIPTSFMKKFLPELVPIMTNIINDSFRNGRFPDKFKCANIIPKLKGSSCDSDNLKNYRPIANLKFFAKILEKMAAHQLQEYLGKSDLHAKFQSGYRSFHSVETALLRVTNDILLSLDRGEEVMLILLDFSSAFDTIDHDILLKRLSLRFGICGEALNWMQSYLSGRTHNVVIGNDRSSGHVLTKGVPQGSVLGPVLFTLYTSPLESLIERHNIFKMFYADDTQLYITFKQSRLENVSSQIANCVQAIKEWSHQNCLKLNCSKTEFLHVSSRFRNTTPVIHLDLAGKQIKATKTCRNLGVIFDNKLTFDNFITQKCRSASFALYKIGKIRDFIDRSTTERLVHAFVMCHFDFCNSLLFQLPLRQIQRLQTIQNSAARLVTRTRKHASISPVLRNLHWLPVQSRIKFKILLLAYECFHGLAPAYLNDLLTVYKPTRNLRSCKKNLFIVPPIITRTYGERSFVHAAPVLWNSLPDSLRNINTLDRFKSALKTHLFQMAK